MDAVNRGTQTDDQDTKKETDNAEAGGGTLHIHTENGSIVLSFGDAAETEEEKQIGIVTTNGSRLNVRSGGGMNYEILDQLRPGEQVEVRMVRR